MKRMAVILVMVMAVIQPGHLWARTVKRMAPSGTSSTAADKTAPATNEKAQKEAAAKNAALEKIKLAEKNAGQSDEKKAEWIEQTLDYGIQEERLSAVA